MLTESVLMKGMFHINIYPIIGASTDDEKHPLLIFPHTDLGNFKKFLLKCRVSDITHPVKINPQIFSSFLITNFWGKAEVVKVGNFYGVFLSNYIFTL